MIRIDPEEFENYMELLQSGFSASDIERAVLDPMDDEIRVTAERLRNLLQETVSNREEKNQKIISREEIVDITREANLEIGKCKDKLQKMRTILSPMVELKEKRVKELRAAHQAHLGLMKVLHELRSELKNTPKDPKWIDLNKLAERGSKVCGSSQKLHDSKGHLDFEKRVKMEIQRSKESRINKKDTHEVKKIAEELKLENESN